MLFRKLSLVAGVVLLAVLVSVPAGMAWDWDPVLTSNVIEQETVDVPQSTPENEDFYTGFIVYNVDPTLVWARCYFNGELVHNLTVDDPDQDHLYSLVTNQEDVIDDDLGNTDAQAYVGGATFGSPSTDRVEFQFDYPY